MLLPVMNEECADSCSRELSSTRERESGIERGNSELPSDVTMTCAPREGKEVRLNYYLRSCE